MAPILPEKPDMYDAAIEKIRSQSPYKELRAEVVELAEQLQADRLKYSGLNNETETNRLIGKESILPYLESGRVEVSAEAKKRMLDTIERIDAIRKEFNPYKLANEEIKNNPILSAIQTERKNLWENSGIKAEGDGSDRILATRLNADFDRAFREGERKVIRRFMSVTEEVIGPLAKSGDYQKALEANSAINQHIRANFKTVDAYHSAIAYDSSNPDKKLKELSTQQLQAMTPVYERIDTVAEEKGLNRNEENFLRDRVLEGLNVGRAYDTLREQRWEKEQKAREEESKNMQGKTSFSKIPTLAFDAINEESALSGTSPSTPTKINVNQRGAQKTGAMNL